MTFKLLMIEAKTWFRSIWYHIKNRKKIKEERKKAEEWANMKPEERLKKQLANKTPQEINKLNKRVEKAKLQGRRMVCARCGKPFGRGSGNNAVTVTHEGKKHYVHERCK